MPARVVVLGRGIERTFVANPLSNAVDRDGPVTVVDPRYALVRTALRLITIRTPPKSTPVSMMSKPPSIFTYAGKIGEPPG
jgi:hypothetical protein